MSSEAETTGSSKNKFIPNETKINFTRARLYEKIRHVVTYPKRSMFGFFFVSLVIWTGVFSVGVRMVYGKDHPINRHTWKKMKKNGELTEEQLQKEENLNLFYKEVFERILTSRGKPRDEDFNRKFLHRNPT